MNAEARRAMCDSKTRYSDKKSAMTVLNFTMKLRGRRGRALRLRAYACPCCNGWHLTKQI